VIQDFLTLKHKYQKSRLQSEACFSVCFYQLSFFMLSRGGGLAVKIAANASLLYLKQRFQEVFPDLFFCFFRL